VKPILAPHPKQDGFVYIRVPSGITRWFDQKRTLAPTPLVVWRDTVAYLDRLSESRTISSRRVERAVENDGYLAKCAEEDLGVVFMEGYWTVAARWPRETVGRAKTLREAYYRYKAATR
jgi:hypothetical protein